MSLNPCITSSTPGGKTGLFPNLKTDIVQQQANGQVNLSLVSIDGRYVAYVNKNGKIKTFNIQTSAQVGQTIQFKYGVYSPVNIQIRKYGKTLYLLWTAAELQGNPCETFTRPIKIWKLSLKDDFPKWRLIKEPKMDIAYGLSEGVPRVAVSLTSPIAFAVIEETEDIRLVYGMCKIPGVYANNNILVSEYTSASGDTKSTSMFWPLLDLKGNLGDFETSFITKDGLFAGMIFSTSLGYCLVVVSVENSISTSYTYDSIGGAAGAITRNKNKLHVAVAGSDNLELHTFPITNNTTIGAPSTLLYPLSEMSDKLVNMNLHPFQNYDAAVDITMTEDSQNVIVAFTYTFQQEPWEPLSGVAQYPVKDLSKFSLLSNVKATGGSKKGTLEEGVWNNGVFQLGVAVSNKGDLAFSSTQPIKRERKCSSDCGKNNNETCGYNSSAGIFVVNGNKCNGNKCSQSDICGACYGFKPIKFPGHVLKKNNI